MRTLAVETSCDDSAAALLMGARVREAMVLSQTAHSAHGGVVPELAGRMHLASLPALVDSLLRRTGTELPDLDLVAATAGPGLVGSLLVGLSWAKALAFALRIPFIAVNHLAAHLHALYDPERPVAFPCVALLVSGGHTCLFLMSDWSRIELLGATRDDAAGEAFDKCAKVLGLPYPGGPALDSLAERGDPCGVDLPAPMPDPGDPEFSFSGLKTAAALAAARGAIPEDLAASFRRVVVELLVSKTVACAQQRHAGEVLVAGGVAANSLLRRELAASCDSAGLSFRLPEAHLATDNAVMVGLAAARLCADHPGIRSGLDCNAFARWDGDFLETHVE